MIRQVLIREAGKLLCRVGIDASCMDLMVKPTIFKGQHCLFLGILCIIELFSSITKFMVSRYDIWYPVKYSLGEPRFKGWLDSFMV